MSAPRPVHEFDAGTVTQIAEYMNTGRPDSLRLIAIAATGDTAIRSARVESFDGESVSLSLDIDDSTRTIAVARMRSITRRFEVREQFMALYERALDDL